MANAPLNITARRRRVRLIMKAHDRSDALWAQLLAAVHADRGMSFVQMATNCINNSDDERRLTTTAVY